MKKSLYVVLLFCSISHPASLAKSNTASLQGQKNLSHDEVIAREPVLVNRALQSLLGEIGAPVLSQSPDLNDVDVLLLDSGRVDSFYSSSGYIYLTRGLFFLANNESHIASIVALEVASLEGEQASEFELYKRAADILHASAYSPEALTEFLSILLRHQRYVENNQSAQQVIGQSYARLTKEIDGSLLGSLQAHISQLNSQAALDLVKPIESEFLMLLDGLAVGQSPSIVLRRVGPQTVKEESFTLFLPDNWTSYRRDQVAEAIPFKANALGIESNDSIVVLRSPLKQAKEIIIFDLEQADLDRSAQQNLRRHLNSVSTKSKVSRQGPINGVDWQGYLVEGRVSVEIKGGQEARGISLGSGITTSFKHISAVVHLADKAIVLTMFPMMFGNDYDELDIDAFSSVVSSIRVQGEGLPETGHRRIKIHKVVQGQDIASLAKDSILEDAAPALRVLNGLGADDQVEVGQLIKLIDNRE